MLSRVSWKEELFILTLTQINLAVKLVLHRNVFTGKYKTRETPR